MHNFKNQIVHWITHRIQRYIATWIRYQKAQNTTNWLARWDIACTKAWRILTKGTPTRQRFERFERNHNRLCQVIERKLVILRNLDKKGFATQKPKK